MVRKTKPAKKAIPAKARTKPGTSPASAANRHHAFIEAYLTNGGNATAAAQTAGYSPGPSARVQGSRLLADPNIAAKIKARQVKVAEKLELSTESVLRSLAQAVHFDPRKLFKEDGTAKLPHELDDDTAAAIGGIEFEADPKTGKVISAKFKAVEKNAARDQAMKHLGMFKADNVQRNPLDGLPREVLKAIAERLRG